MNAVTDKQRSVLRAIAESVRDKGYPPTHRELCATLGIRSTNGIAENICSLERKGCLQRLENTAKRRKVVARAVALTEHGWREAGVARTALKKVVVVRDGHQFRASFADAPLVSQLGESAQAALGRLVGIVPAAFGIEIVSAETPARGVA